MSIFLIRQTAEYTVMLADSLTMKEHPSGEGTIPGSAPKLAHVSPGIYAAHAGTWQPAWAMLSDLHSVTTKKGRRLTHTQLLSTLSHIGPRRYAEYQTIFGRKTFDVRIALVVTGCYRSPKDTTSPNSTSIILWEAGRDFEPLIVSRELYFASNKPLSDFVRHTLNHPVTEKLLGLSPLSTSQALVAAHRAAATLSTSISSDPNVVLIGAGAEHALLHGAMLPLPMPALALG
jgi:hypothetical protein